MGTTLSGWFKNCYGLQDFKLNTINFVDTNGKPANKAIIYAPNGVMKTSFARVFEDISKKRLTTDRIFKNPSSYEVTYRESTYSNTNLNQVDEVYVINSFDDLFQCRSSSIPLLLADAEARRKYQEIYLKFAEVVERFRDGLVKPSDLGKAKIQEQIVSDFQLPEKSDWMGVFAAIGGNLGGFSDSDLYSGFKYSDVFNDKTARIFKDPTFLRAIEEYVTRLAGLISNNTLLSNDFDDRNAEELGKSLTKNNLFKAEHSIRLRDGTFVQNVSDWNSRVSSELKKLYGSTTMTSAFENLRKQLAANAESQKLLQIIRSNMGIIGLFADIPGFKKKMWLHWVSSLGEPFDASYHRIIEYQDAIHAVYEQASGEKERWQSVIDEFNQRFNVPFRVTIDNQPDVILTDQVPKVRFLYERARDGDEGAEAASYDDRMELMKVLSTGEMRALYLLYVLFDVKNIMSSANQDSKKHLVIADDIADSFDYKNKYAIVQYLEDISSVENIDLLLLTHNFDFYRTAVSRLNIYRENCYIVQKGRTDRLKMDVFGRQKDYFKDTILTPIRNGKIAHNENKKKCLIASIPFCRNLSEYRLDTETCDFLTHLLHVSHDNPATDSITVGQLWGTLKDPLNLGDLDIDNREALAVDLIKSSADRICEDTRDETSLVNKIVISIAIRLETERFLEGVLVRHERATACSSYQTRQWACDAKQYLEPEVYRVISSVCLMTPEEIHINAFMYEPIIDMSDWALKDLYGKVKNLAERQRPA